MLLLISVVNHVALAQVAQVVCTLTLKPTVSGCYQNNGSKVTVNLEVAWANATVSTIVNDASDAITVTFAGQTKTINPGPYTSTGGSGTIVSPQVVAFEVPANASSQTAQAFFGADYASSSCKVEQTGIVLPAACPPTVCSNGQTGGTVWNDYNADGVKQSGETTGLSGVTVKAYDCNGTLVGTATTDAFGKYAFTGLTADSYPIRVEFSNLPSFAGQGTVNGTDGRTTVQFVTAADCNVDLGILDPTDYCQSTPKVFVPCYVSGDPITGTSSGNGDALVSFPYGTKGLKDMSKISVIATADKIGTLWGMAYSKKTKKLYGTAVIKRHSGLGPQGIGGLYSIDVATNTVTGIDLSTLGINVGSIAANSARGLVSDPNQPSADAQAFTAIGKEGLGDLDMNADGSFLYVVSLKDKKLNKLDITGASPTLAGSYTIPNPGCTGGDWRPFALKVFKGKVYVGGVCDAQSSDNKSNLRAYVYTFDESSSSFNATPVFDFPLTYPKGYPDVNYPDRTGWHPWSDDFSRMVIVNPYNSSDLNLVYPQPMFTDIEFDIDGSMLLGFGDRAGLQSGLRNADLTGSVSPRWVNGVSGGDILRATLVGNAYLLENAAKAGANVGYAPTNNQGPGFGEFYNDDFFYGSLAVHTESIFGGLALRPGSGEVIATSMDPIDYPNTGEDFNLYGNSGGIRYLNNNTGLRNAGFILYNSFIAFGTFGKATGLGDVEVGCDLPMYLEVGNRVWNDVNKNGIQDPCEKALKDVNVTLYKGTTKIATTKTDVNGEYYFSSKSKLGAGWIGTGADTALLANTAYKLVFGEGQLTGGKLTITGLGQFDVTIKDATANNGNDQNDSDAEILSGAFCINLTTGTTGSVNHTFDAGFYCSNPAIGNKIAQTAPTCSGITPNNNGKITLSAAVTPYDKYRVKTGTAPWTGDTTYATATAIGASFPLDLVTAIPNAGATYLIRFYVGECCYKDTTVTVAPVTCNCTNPVLTDLTDQSICVGGSFTPSNVTTSVTNGVSVTYQWYNDNGPANPTTTAISGQQSATLTALPTTAGVYKYRVEATNTVDASCKASKTVTLTINALPTATAAATDPTCVAGSSTVNSDGKITLSGFGATDKYDYTTGATYTGSATYVAGSTTIPAGGIIVSNLPNPSGATQQYTVRIFNSAGCFIDRTVIINKVTCNCTNPILTDLTNQSICVGGSFTPSNVTTSVTNGVSVTYQWYNDNGTANPTTTAISGQQSATLTALPTTAGVYKYRVEATNTVDASCKSHGQHFGLPNGGCGRQYVGLRQQHHGH
ncbi:MAG: SdrD B-like domain-containing protein [Spirosomataceae bacterium]